MKQTTADSDKTSEDQRFTSLHRLVCRPWRAASRPRRLKPSNRCTAVAKDRCGKRARSGARSKPAVRRRRLEARRPPPSCRRAMRAGASGAAKASAYELVAPKETRSRRRAESGRMRDHRSMSSRRGATQPVARSPVASDQGALAFWVICFCKILPEIRIDAVRRRSVGRHDDPLSAKRLPSANIAIPARRAPQTTSGVTGAAHQLTTGAAEGAPRRCCPGEHDQASPGQALPAPPRPSRDRAAARVLPGRQPAPGDASDTAPRQRIDMGSRQPGELGRNDDLTPWQRRALNSVAADPSGGAHLTEPSRQVKSGAGSRYFTRKQRLLTQRWRASTASPAPVSAAAQRGDREMVVKPIARGSCLGAPRQMRGDRVTPLRGFCGAT